MGGLGSGRKPDGERKRTVNESCTIAISEYSTAISTGYDRQMLCCKNWNGYHFVFHVAIIRGTQNSMKIQFFPRTLSTKGAQQCILLEEKVGEFCNRWWFRCPMNQDDGACGKRVAKLHLPPKATKFGCRDCHDLSYTSSQKAHKTERMAKAN